MVDAVAMVAVAAAAIAELQVRVGHIGAATDGAAVIVVFGRLCPLLIGEGDGFAGFWLGCRGGTAALRNGPKGRWQQIKHILTCI